MSSEIERLNQDIEELKAFRKRLAEQVHTERIESRTTPPLSGLTRVQKRYFLEPWFTTIAVGTAGLGVVAGFFAIWTPFHWRFGFTAGLFLLIAGLAMWAKIVHKDYNVRSEGDLIKPKRDSYFD